MKRKILSVVMLLTLAICLTVTFAYADVNIVTGSIGSSDSVIVVSGSVTLTCSYTSSLGNDGTGRLLISGPASDPSSSSAFDDWSTLYKWDGLDGRPVLTSGVPVTYDKQLTAEGYYKFQWQCKASDGTDGAYTEVLVHVVGTPEELPEASPVLAILACFAAVGAVGLVTTKKAKLPTKFF
jgi:hypothetical protein